MAYCQGCADREREVAALREALAREHYSGDHLRQENCPTCALLAPGAREGT